MAGCLSVYLLLLIFGRVDTEGELKASKDLPWRSGKVKFSEFDAASGRNVLTKAALT